MAAKSSQQTNLDKKEYREADQNIVPEKMLYENLSSYFKELVKYASIAITVIASIALFFTWQDRAAMKEELRSMIAEAQQTVRETQIQVNQEIDKIKSRASEIAIQEAEKKIHETLSTGSVNEIVVKAIDSFTAQKVEDIVQKATDSVKAEILLLGTIVDNATKMRIGHREGLDNMLKIIKNEENALMRNKALEIFNVIASDYEKFAKDSWVSPSYDQSDIAAVKKLKSKLVQEIEVETSLGPMAELFLSLRSLGEEKLGMFDFDGVASIARSL